MGQYNLNRIFKPRHVAVVGASEKKETIGNALMRNLIDGGFSGLILPVNPKYKTIHGHECVGSISAINTGVDLAIIATPIHTVVDIVQETKAYSLLKGYRNRPPADMKQLEEMIVRLSQLLIDFPEIAELDMNPVLIKNGNPVAVDARILVSPLEPTSSLHLVIGPYPEEEESHIAGADGRRIFIRPVKPEDAPLFTALFKVLSPTTIYYRFFGMIKELNPEMLARFTQIDYDREIALVALDEEIGEDSETERLLGVGRIIGDPDGKTGEFAVLVGDAWQGQDIGWNLLEKCLAIAEKRGFEMIHGIVLKENAHMLALGKKLGFEIHQDPDAGDPELVIHFRKNRV